MDNPPTVEILCLGNELLIGRTLNTNATYLSHELSKIGFKVTHVITVRDEKDSIIQAIKWIETRKPDIVIVNGGMGPTHDDIQLETLAEAFKIELQLNDEAVGMLENRYNLPKDEISDVRLKMAKLPKDSIPLHNSEGTAPGVETQQNSSIWYSLPGVPREMKAIFNEIILPKLKQDFELPELVELGFNAYGIGESMVEPIVMKILKKYPDVYIKSHPKNTEVGYWVALHLLGQGEFSREQVKNATEELYKELKLVAKRVTDITSLFNEHFVPE
jgi:nicotinamide-nucleotide amidase